MNPQNKQYYKSLIDPQTKQDVIIKYTKSSRLSGDARKSRWGSEVGMLNRFHLGINIIDWKKVKYWLDIGCGTGLFFSVAEKKGFNFNHLTGIDITSEIINQARQRPLSSSTRYEVCDLETMPKDIKDMDLVTMIGVLQLCGCPLITAITAGVERLKKGGQIFITTKNLNWKEFSKKNIIPEAGHSWFLFRDIREAVEKNSIKISEYGGFLPREGKKVPLTDSHTLFVLGTKN